LDLQLSGNSALEVLAELKSDERTKSIPVMMTSTENRRSEVMAQGASGFLAKPFSLTEIRAELERVTGTNLDSTPFIKFRTKDSSPLILLADDNELTLQTLTDFLQQCGIQIISARTGMEAIDLVSEFHPDMVLMDIQMPGMDGLEATRSLRAHPDPLVNSVPIIALTALALSGDRERCLEAGANEYLSKPVRLKKLAALIHEILEGDSLHNENHAN
jgi:CheY-like chemotaxis protein